jgi:uncharacterized protein (TIRG00374 family)
VFASGATIYLLLPALMKVFAAWPRLSKLDLLWMLAALGAEIGSFVCTFGLKRLALSTTAWFPVVTAALTGNSVTNILPGGDATGAAIEYRMLSTAGIGTGAVIGGPAATGFIQTGSLLALPVIAVPTVLVGSHVSRGLVHVMYLGVALFAAYTVLGVVVFRTDKPIALAGRLAQGIRNRALPHRTPLTGLDQKLLSQRDATAASLGRHWKMAVLLASGRVALDFACLLGVLAATRSDPRPSLVLVAYAATMVVALLPVTPGGLGLVEGSMVGLLVLAGIPAGTAVLSTLGYRILSYWLPILAGPIGYAAFRIRYRNASAKAGPSLTAADR